MKTLTLLIASVSCCLSAAPALAESGNAPLTVTGSNLEDPYTIRVSYGDLNLANDADAGVLRSRVRKAIRRTCGALYSTAFLSQEWACADIANGIARPQVAAAIDRAKTGREMAGRYVVLRLVRR